MSDAPHDKEKKKDQSEQNWAYLILLLIKLVVAIFVIVHLCACAFLSGSFVVYLIKYPYLTSDQVGATCIVLELPADSTFCTETDRQTSETLEEIFEQIYPIGITTVSDLKDRFKTIECLSLPRCFLELPQPRSLMISHEQGIITGYEVTRND